MYTQSFRQKSDSSRYSVENILGSDSVKLAIVDPKFAPLAVSLEFAAGGVIGVRAVDGGFLRPVLSPNGNKICDLDAFARAALGSTVWADSPFLSDVFKRHDPEMLVRRARDKLEIAGVGGSLDASRWGDDSTLESERNAILRRLGQMRVVDGVVHAPCDEPRIAIFRDVNNIEQGVFTGWTLGDVDEFRHPVQGHFRRLDPDVVAETGVAIARLDESVTRFHIGREDDAEAFARAWNEGVGLSHISRNRSSVTIVDSDLLPRDDDALSLYGALRESFGLERVHACWKSILRMPEKHDQWREIREIVLGDSSPDLSKIEGVFDSLVGIMENGPKPVRGQDGNAVVASLIALRWEAVERDHVSTSLMGEYRSRRLAM